MKKVIEEVQLHMTAGTFSHENETVVGFFVSRVDTSTPVPVPTSREDAQRTLPRLFETGTCTSRPLQALEGDSICVHVHMYLLCVYSLAPIH